MKLGKLFLTVSLISGMALGAGTRVWAEEKAPPDLNQYLADLQVKLDHAAQRANQPAEEGSSVVGLRGTKVQPVSQKLYWKTPKGKVRVTPEEIKLYRTAVEQAQTGNPTEAVASLKTFQEKYPKSGLTPDVQETLNRLEPPPAKP